MFALDTISYTPDPSYQFDRFYITPENYSVPDPEEAQVAQAQHPDYTTAYDGNFKPEDSCVSLDEDTLGRIMESLTEFLGPQNFQQLLTSQDFNFADSNMNPQDVFQSGINTVATFNDYNDPEDMHIEDVILRQVKTENEEESWRLWRFFGRVQKLVFIRSALWCMNAR